jgi:argininosuccinate synthase
MESVVGCRANSQYEGVYLLGTSIARPLIAKRQIEIAREVGGCLPPLATAA